MQIGGETRFESGNLLLHILWRSCIVMWHAGYTPSMYLPWRFRRRFHTKIYCRIPSSLCYAIVRSLIELFDVCLGFCFNPIRLAQNILPQAWLLSGWSGRGASTTSPPDPIWAPFHRRNLYLASVMFGWTRYWSWHEKMRDVIANLRLWKQMHTLYWSSQ